MLVAQTACPIILHWRPRHAPLTRKRYHLITLCPEEHKIHPSIDSMMLRHSSCLFALGAFLAAPVLGFSPTTPLPRSTTTTTTTLYGSVVDLTDDNFGQLLNQKKSNPKHQVALVDCYAPWCGPCRLMEPVLAELANQYDPDTQVLVCRYNVEGNPTAGANRFKVELALQGCLVSALPALILLDAQGHVLESWTGLQSQHKLETAVQSYLQQDVDATTIAADASATQKGTVGVGTWQQQEEDSYMLANPYC